MEVFTIKASDALNRLAKECRDRQLKASITSKGWGTPKKLLTDAAAGLRQGRTRGSIR